MKTIWFCTHGTVETSGSTPKEAFDKCSPIAWSEIEPLFAEEQDSEIVVFASDIKSKRLLRESYFYFRKEIYENAPP